MTRDQVDEIRLQRPVLFGIASLCAFGGFAAALLIPTATPAAVAAASAAPVRKCVGMFVSNERRQVAADTKGLEITGGKPCPEGVMTWAQVGVYRVFDDGSVEFLASPAPPCPTGDTYVWIRYPNP
jgi:hypothetical protein